MTQIDLIESASDSQTFPAGQYIFRVGDPADVMYAVVEGEVEILYNHRVLEEIGPGGLFGEMALISDQVRSADALTRTECKLVVVDEERFMQLVSQTPYFALNVMRVMAERLRRETER